MHFGTLSRNDCCRVKPLDDTPPSAKLPLRVGALPLGVETFLEVGVVIDPSELRRLPRFEGTEGMGCRIRSECKLSCSRYMQKGSIAIFRFLSAT